MAVILSKSALHNRTRAKITPEVNNPKTIVPANARTSRLCVLSRTAHNRGNSIKTQTTRTIRATMLVTNLLCMTIAGDQMSLAGKQRLYLFDRRVLTKHNDLVAFVNFGVPLGQRDIAALQDRSDDRVFGQLDVLQCVTGDR